MTTNLDFVDVQLVGSGNCTDDFLLIPFFFILNFTFSCENPCPKDQYGMMCHRKCQCNNNRCDPQTGECLSENAKIVFDVSHNRSSNIMKLSSDRIKAKHWIPVSGNGKITLRNCSDPNRCEINVMHGRNLNEPDELKEEKKAALIDQFNPNLSNLTNKSVAIVVNSSIAIHHIHKSVTDAQKNHKFKDSLSPSITEQYSTDTENEDFTYDQINEFDDDQQIDGNIEDSGEIDSIGGYNDIVHVFAMSSINTTKSV